MQKKYEDTKVCIIGDGIHSKRIQDILKKKKINFFIYKPKSKKGYKKNNLKKLKKFKYIFIVTPNNAHAHYVEYFYKKSFIFCEKPPTNNLDDLQKLQKINSNKIYFNYNYRFCRIAQILKDRKKYHLGKLIYANIVVGHGLALKKEYLNSWRSNKKKCPKGVFEMLSVHWIDLINHIFKVTNQNKPELKNLSGVGNSYDNSKINLKIEKKIDADIFSSYTSPVINKKTFIFDNGFIEQNENEITIKGPSLNYDQFGFLKLPKKIKSFKINEKKDYYQSLEKSIDYFFFNIKTKKNFSKSDYKAILKLNKMII